MRSWLLNWSFNFKVILCRENQISGKSLKSFCPLGKRGRTPWPWSRGQAIVFKCSWGCIHPVLHLCFPESPLLNPDVWSPPGEGGRLWHTWFPPHLTLIRNTALPPPPWPPQGHHRALSWATPDSCCYSAETNMTLSSNYPPVKKKNFFKENAKKEKKYSSQLWLYPWKSSTSMYLVVACSLDHLEVQS